MSLSSSGRGLRERPGAAAERDARARASSPRWRYHGSVALRRVFVAAVVALTALALPAACGGTSDSAEPGQHPDGGKPDSALDSPVADGPGSDGCFPQSCATLGAQCGQVDDKCGLLLDCGQCPAGKFCGGAGPNRCGSSPCIPKTCADFAGKCGLISDGCSAVLTCTSCQAPETCGGGGVPDECGCTPKTCASLGVSCGKASDGCGAELDCGPCTQPPVCGNGACEPGENGASCGQDCCDAQTPCSQTKQNQGQFYCRQINGGSYQWYTEAQGITFCDEPSEICVATFSCGGQSGTCKTIPGGWVFGPC